MNDGRARISKSRQGRAKVAHGFNRGLRVKNSQSPGRARLIPESRERSADSHVRELSKISPEHRADKAVRAAS